MPGGLGFRRQRGILGSGGDEDVPGAKHFSDLGQAFFAVWRFFIFRDSSDEDGRPLSVAPFAAYGFPFGLGIIVVHFVIVIGLLDMILAVYVGNIMAAAIERYDGDDGDFLVLVGEEERSVGEPDDECRGGQFLPGSG
eukprot:9658610-Alexandrium_andersonii.AAC.1